MHHPTADCPVAAVAESRWDDQLHQGYEWLLHAPSCQRGAMVTFSVFAGFLQGAGNRVFGVQQHVVAYDRPVV